MRVHEAEAILKYYADIPQRIEIIRRQCAALNDEIDPMRVQMGCRTADLTEIVPQ